MANIQSRGECYLCKKTFGKRSMAAHLRSCRETNGTIPQRSRKTQALHLVVEGEYEKTYWMHLEADVKATLGDLDDLLRHTWLECCGHMSAFESTKKKQSVAPLDFMKAFDVADFSDSFQSGDLDFSTTLGKALPPKENLRYTYDFGSSTILLIHSLSLRETKLSAESIQIQSRNLAPEILCGICEKPATQVCTECEYESEGWLCDDCFEDHECDESMSLPIVNSPRVGVCGYMGEA
jgi:hypothetical protein